MRDAEGLLRRIRALPPARIEEVEDFVAFIAAREEGRSLIQAAAAASTPAFASVWDNADDACYDEL